MNLLPLLITLATFLAPTPPTSSCDVSEIYQEVALDGDLLVETYGSIERPLRAWRPADLDPGTYRVDVRKNGDFYEAKGGAILLETYSCYENSYGETEAILRVTAYSAELEFPDPW